MRILLSVMLICFCTAAAYSASDIYGFEHPEQQQRFSNLLSNFRCLVCQNQSLAESNAPLAKDLRSLIYKQIIEGADDQHIKAHLKKRYGEFILYKPPVNKSTFILWFGPILFLLFGFGLFLSKTITLRNKQ